MMYTFMDLLLCVRSFDHQLDLDKYSKNILNECMNFGDILFSFKVKVHPPLFRASVFSFSRAQRNCYSCSVGAVVGAGKGRGMMGARCAASV